MHTHVVSDVPRDRSGCEAGSSNISSSSFDIYFSIKFIFDQSIRAQNQNAETGRTSWSNDLTGTVLYITQSQRGSQSSKSKYQTQMQNYLTICVDQVKSRLLGNFAFGFNS